MVREAYQDTYLLDAIQSAESVLSIGKVPVTRSSWNREGFLPHLNDLSHRYCKWENDDAGKHEFAVQVEEQDVAYVDYDYTFHTYVAEPVPGREGLFPAVLRNFQVPQAVEVVVDLSEQTATIAVSAEESLVFRSVESWLENDALLESFNQHLIPQGYLVWKVSFVNEASTNDFWSDGLAVLANEHAVAHCTGYAYDHEQDFLAYVGCVAHKTALESLRATLLQGKKVSLNHGRRSFLGTMNRKVIHLSQPMPHFASYHAAYFARETIPGKWQSGDAVGYVLSLDETPIASLVGSRLMEVLTIPLLADWSDDLYTAAVEAGYCVPLVCFGDCQAGVRLNLEADWQALVQSLFVDCCISL